MNRSIQPTVEIDILLWALLNRSKELKIFYGGNLPISHTFNENDAIMVREVYDVYHNYFENLLSLHPGLEEALKYDGYYLYMEGIIALIAYVRK